MGLRKWPRRELIKGIRLRALLAESFVYVVN